MSSSKSAKTPVPAQKNTLFGWVKKSTPDAPAASAAQAPVAAPSNTVPAVAVQPSPTSDVVTASSLSFSAGDVAKLESPPAVPVHPSTGGKDQSAQATTSNESTQSISSKPAAAQSVAVHSSATTVAAAMSSAMDEDDEDDGPISLGALKAKRASLLSNAANQSMISSTSTTAAATPAQSTASVFFGSGKTSAGASLPSNSSSSAPPNKRSRKATPKGKEKGEEEGDDDDEDASIPDDEDEDDGDDMDDDEEDDDDGFVRRKKGSGTGKGPGQRKAKAACGAGAGAGPSKGGKKATPAAAGADSGTKRKREEDAPAVDGDDGAEGETGEGADAAVGGVYPAGKHSHDAIPWIKAEGIRDAQGRRPDHPDYDFRTLLVPKDFFKATKVTPAQQQWWLMKAQYADTVLFFKQGKFYELFHQDADVGVAHGGLTYMRGESAHCGFPEICYGAVSAALVSKGYRVARVEQVETPEAAKVRQDYLRSKAKGGRGGLDEADKVVRRELCGIKSKGTRTAGVLDVFAGATAMRAAAALRGGGGDSEGTLPSSIVDAAYGDTSGLVTAMGGQGDKATALYSIKEVPVTGTDATTSSSSSSQQSLDAAGAASAVPVLLAVAIVDCMAGEIILAQWVDDSHRSRLRTLLSRVPAAELVYESGASGCSAWTRRVLGYDAPAALHTPMRPGVDYWTAAHAAGELSLAHYSSIVQEAYADPAPKLEEPAVLDQQSMPRVLQAGTESKASYMHVRNRDYFLAKEEAASPSTVPPVGEAGPAMVTHQGPDGKDRTVPAVLAELMERSASMGHSLDADVQAALSSLPSPSSPSAADVPLGPTALSALGAAVHVLRRHLLDHSVLSMRRMYRYTHADGIEGALALLQSAHPAELPPNTGRGEGVGVPHMILDATALAHMEVLETSDGKVKGSLIGLLDVCACSAGRARLRAWLSAPLLQPEDIEDRLHAVENIMAVTGRAVDARSPVFPTAQGILSSSDPIPGSALHSDMKKALSGLPDLDRLLARIHTLGSKVAAKDHPDARAIMYENDTYSKRRIGDIVAALTAFRAVAKVRDLFHQRTSGGAGDVQSWVKAPMLMRCAHSNFPDLRPILSWFDSTYDLSAISKTGKVEPVAGQDAIFDQACAEIQSIQKELKAFERQARIDYSCSGIAYGNEDVNNKDPYLLEVPAQAKDDVPEDWRLVGQRKAGKVPVMKYVAPEVEEMVKRLEAATEKKKEASRDALRKMFSRFDSFSSLWQTAASAIATLDCIFALAVWSGAGDGGAMCRPKVLPMNDASAPFLHTSGARHPTLSIGLGSAGSSLGPASFIPNDIALGKGQPSMCLLTGPNMGGKSTYLRTACTAVLLSQLGCYVPASSCTLTPVDRIFTRVGAHDRILAGQSTFYVELAETGVILGQASKHSLVILDELGRGTSTFDGAAIAYAVTRHLVDTIQARTLFATHYHTLCDDFAENEKVALGHMVCTAHTHCRLTHSLTSSQSFFLALLCSAASRLHGKTGPQM